MTAIKAVKTVQDAISFSLYPSDLASFTKRQSEKRDIPCLEGIKWWMNWMAVSKSRDCVFVLVQMDKAYGNKVSAVIDGVSTPNDVFKVFVDDENTFILADHPKLRPFFHNGKLTITCTVEFDIPVHCSYLRPSMFGSCNHVPTDLKLVTEAGCIEVHKSFLSLVSPVFHAMFTHDTKESKSGMIKITDFDYNTIKTTIDFCYGREISNWSIESVLGVLRFADKYDIKAIIDQLAKIPSLNLSIDNFALIVHYAYDCSKDLLLTECNNFFKANQKSITKTKSFGQLPPPLVVTILQGALSLKTNFDVLRYAHRSGIEFVLEHLERPFLESLTINDFVPAVIYAWACSRDELKKACAMFVNKNRDAVMTSKAFLNLMPVTVAGVLKLACDLDHVTG